ncbi:MAG: class C sortase [Ruminococcus sp.]|uniref:class C sortase n=1 Tax=Ruminococcus sp. TaxID=41978 RepID=UPI0026000FB4|nr:class C sortase [Ruminococcus sp.]MCR5599649.1 class C sortase [Ruminococcus sp.]
MSKKKNIITTLFLILMLLMGLFLMLYPSFSNWWNSKRQSKAISNYEKTVAEMDDSTKKELLIKAEEYNLRLAELSDPFTEYDSISGYDDILDITGTGVMGYIDIPKINLFLPIYHGTSDEVLNIAVGHMQGSSLPIGGIGCHSVISAHRGLPSAKLFTNIDQLIEDDTFTITVLDEVLTYEVDQTEVILPYETNKLAIVPNMDCVTLMTCTPYGINTHRMLVRAHRIDTASPHCVKVPADGIMADDMTVYTVIAAAVLIILLIFWIVSEHLLKCRSVTKDSIYDIPLKKDK